MEVAREAPKQVNSYDCGVYVLAIAEAVLQSPKDPKFSIITPEYVTRKREDIKNTIARLISEKR